MATAGQSSLPTHSLRRLTLRLPVVAAAVALTATLVPAGSPASAEPRAAAALPAHPTLKSVEAQIGVLNGKAEKLTEAYDGARDNLTALTKQERTTNATLKADQAKLSKDRQQVGAAAAAAYRSGGMSPALSLVSSGSPSSYIDQAGSLDAIARSQAQQVAAAAAAARQVTADQVIHNAQVVQARKAVASIATNKAGVQKLLGQEQQLLSRLKASARAKLAREQARAHAREVAERTSYHPAAAVSHSSSPAAPAPTYHGSASGSAAAAVKFAYAQLGKPYVYGAAGPSSYDCSGLTMRAWGAAGVSLPHNAAAQQGMLPSVSLGALEPGDLVFFGDPAYHVAIYIGDGKIIQAPHTGADVEITPLSYMSPSSAGRP